MKNVLTSILASVALLGANAASAAVIITAAPDDPNVNVDDSNGPANDTVHLIADGLYNDLFVFGTTGPTDVGVIIEGNENIKPSNTGTPQAWVVDTAGNGLSYLSFSLAGGFNFDAI